MSRLSDEIKSYVTVGEHYGKWGAMNKEQREKIKQLCEQCEMFERTADEYGKKLKNAKIDTLNRLRECIYDADKYVCITDEVLLHIIDSLKGE